LRSKWGRRGYGRWYGAHTLPAKGPVSRPCSVHAPSCSRGDVRSPRALAGMPGLPCTLALKLGPRVRPVSSVRSLACRGSGAGMVTLRNDKARDSTTRAASAPRAALAGASEEHPRRRKPHTRHRNRAPTRHYTCPVPHCALTLTQLHRRHGKYMRSPHRATYMRRIRPESSLSTRALPTARAALPLWDNMLGRSDVDPPNMATALPPAAETICDDMDAKTPQRDA
jgi:hypothetical protein